MEGLRGNDMMTEQSRESPRDASGVALLRTVARALTPPVGALLLVGLVAAIRNRLVADAEAAAALCTISLPELASPRQFMAPLGLLTAGLVLLATAPMLTVLSVMLAHGHGRRWREAAIAAGVLAILAVSVAFKTH